MHRRRRDWPISESQQRSRPFQILLSELLVHNRVRSGFRRQIADHCIQRRENLCARIDRSQRQVLLARRPRQPADEQFQISKSGQQFGHVPDDPCQARVCEVCEVDGHRGEAGTRGRTAIPIIEDDIPEPAVRLHAGFDRGDEAGVHENRAAGFGAHLLPSGQVNFTDRIKDAVRIRHSSASTQIGTRRAGGLFWVSAARLEVQSRWSSKSLRVTAEAACHGRKPPERESRFASSRTVAVSNKTDSERVWPVRR